MEETDRLQFIESLEPAQQHSRLNCDGIEEQQIVARDPKAPPEIPLQKWPHEDAARLL